MCVCVWLKIVVLVRPISGKYEQDNLQNDDSKWFDTRTRSTTTNQHDVNDVEKRYDLVETPGKFRDTTRKARIDWW